MVSNEATTQVPDTRNRLINTIILTGLLVGTLDALLASGNFMLSSGGKSPAIVFKYVASAVFGKSAFAGGAPMVALGLLFHYCIAFIFTILFFLSYPRLPFLARNKWVTAVVYALFVWAVMDFIIVPLTRISKHHFNLSSALINAFILVLSIGIPLSLTAYKYYAAPAKWIRRP